jgi:hypothetical protein
VQQFILMIKYKKVTTNTLVDFLVAPPKPNIISLGSIMCMEPFTYKAYREEYVEDEDFKEVYKKLHR